MKLAIISHTEHFLDDDGTIVGWGPTVTEVNHLLDIFDEIFHIAMLYNTKTPLSALPYSSKRITFVSIPIVGGRTLAKKLNTIWKAPKTINIVTRILKNVDFFQLRTPTGIGVYLIPYLSLFIRKKGWFKYAGNWNQKSPPLGYRLQRLFLKKQKRIVTINGRWENQPKQCLTFENPCLNQGDIRQGAEISQNKNLNGLISFCFVGRLEREKGVERIINALKDLPVDFKNRIGNVDFVGDGKELNYFIKLSEKSKVNFKFHGFLSRDQVFSIYKRSHFFLLPTTASEGFPKVIAEALNFGCIPLVSNISSIAQYIKHNISGFIIDPVTSENMTDQLKNILHLSNENYHRLINSRDELIQKFSFDHYNQRIRSEIIQIKKKD